jgi:NAD(P)-dependent dehydrogenase (short-subunit alcohol dehydrogenase family)
MDIGRKRFIVVTGADRGLGYELTRQYLERGEIVFAGKYRRNWNLLEALFKQFPQTLEIVDLDVRDGDAVKNAARRILARTDKLDILINNAGVWLDHDAGTVLDGRLAYGPIAEQFNVNALGALRVTEALIQPLLRGYDKLVANVSSEAGSVAINNKAEQIGYSMSKAAMNMMSRCVWNAIRPLGGMVLNLHPGWMQSVIGGPAGPDAPMEELPSPQRVKFYTTPQETAAGFLKILDEPERFSGGQPGFVNYRGDRMAY